ncbi:carbohydrate sulfotransferase 13 [Rhinolophus ferrumequinum]|uniref:Carbohydrate sulfotransferase n=2 Tax=Rhinolophus ferrumequinum TaxID=59479 RepID=A0A7J7TPZ7_RHIFE|nr:carbohydrate sulfotransferase 13 isoform X1 [Rhinolophus ferrumequinum]KAF6302761.1 carbohydrate sulfotransferase 13 [Rhinolophus ferrumequinum]
MGRLCWRRRALAAACLGAVLLLLWPVPRALLPESENSALGSSWLHGKKKSPLQMLYDLNKGPLSALAEVHRQRRDLLQRACSRHTRRQRLLQPEDLQHVLVDDTHGLLYCYVPKVACTNWKRVLLALNGSVRGDPRSIPAHEVHAPGRLPSLADFSPAEINRRLRAYLAFLFVREPFERLASAYSNKFVRPYSAAFQQRYGTRIVRRLRPRPHPEALARGHDVRFAEFLAYLLDPRTRRDEPFNEHWERAHALCHPCRLRYDIVGKFETLAEDATFVLGFVGLPGLRFPAPPPPAKAATTHDQAARLFQDISPFYQRRLFDLYRMDFLLFNYSTPSYLRLH